MKKKDAFIYRTSPQPIFDDPRICQPKKPLAYPWPLMMGFLEFLAANNAKDRMTDDELRLIVTTIINGMLDIEIAKRHGRDIKSLMPQ